MSAKACSQELSSNIWGQLHFVTRCLSGKWLVVGSLLLTLLGCDIVPRKVAIDDPRIQPLLTAAATFPRSTYGFTPIPKQALVRWESRPTARYDAMLHIEEKTSRTIAFKRDGSGYRWIGEQEIFRGPSTYKTVDGTFNEQGNLNI